MKIKDILKQAMPEMFIEKEDTDPRTVLYIFRAKYFDEHSELPNGIYEFECEGWAEALAKAGGRRYKFVTDGVRSLEIVGKTTFEKKTVRF